MGCDSWGCFRHISSDIFSPVTQDFERPGHTFFLGYSPSHWLIFFVFERKLRVGCNSGGCVRNSIYYIRTKLKAINLDD